MWDEEEVWTPVVRWKRKKSAECVGDGELSVDGGSVMRFRNAWDTGDKYP